MPKALISLHTNLKSLRYGSDTPYITQDINNPPSTSQIGLQPSRQVDDTLRIAKMLVRKPGLQYLANEALLQQVDAQDKVNKAVKGGKSVVGAILSQVGGTFVNTTKIAASTLLQVPANGTGTHFLKGFKTDTYLQPTGGNLASKFAQFFGAGGIEGAPLALEGSEISGIVNSNNQNFGETSADGKEFSPTTPSKYGYGHKPPIFGKLLNKTDDITGDVLNETIPASSENRSTKTNAEGGASIPVGYKKPTRFKGDITPDPRDLSPTKARGIETTPTPGTPIYQSSIKSISNRVDSDSGYVSPDSINNIPSASYSQDNPYSQQPTNVSINNAQAGAPIPVYPLSSSLKETTLQSLGIGYGDASWLQGEQDNLNDGIQQYNEYSTYTGKTTEENIASTLGNSSIATTSQAVGETPINLPDVEATEEDRGLDGQQNYTSGSTYINSRPLEVIKSRRVGLGSQGHPGIPGTEFQKAKKANYYWVTDSNEVGVDKINALDVRGSRANIADDGRDFAKFYFEIITPDGSNFLHFRAFIDSIDDSYSADWAGRQYNGRAEKFYTYGGFDRDISVSFNIAAASRSEMQPLYRKMVYLASATAPTYGNSGLMRGTLAKLTIGSYFSQIPGVLTSVKYSVDNNSPWEIAMANPEAGADDDVQELPMMLKCTVSFKPIHDFAPQTGLYHYFTSPNSNAGSQPFF